MNNILRRKGTIELIVLGKGNVTYRFKLACDMWDRKELTHSGLPRGLPPERRMFVERLIDKTFNDSLEPDELESIINDFASDIACRKAQKKYGTEACILIIDLICASKRLFELIRASRKDEKARRRVDNNFHLIQNQKHASGALPRPVAYMK